MSVPNVGQEHLTQLKLFLDMCVANPSVLHQPGLSFVRTFIEHFGGKLPDCKPEESPSDKEPPVEETMKEPEAEVKAEAEPESEESDLELDMTGVIEPDTDEPQQMGDTTIEPTEDQISESQNKRSEAVSAFVEKDYEKAIQLYTEAIMLNPQASLLYAKRGQVYLLMNKPNACIRDCNRALELNPDSAAAHKFRGRANHLLGKFEEAATDLRLACKFDFDEQADEWLREVTPNAKRIEEHKRKYERKLQERKERERLERIKKAKETAKAHQETAGSQGTGPGTGSDPDMSNFLKFVNDPEVFKSFQDPEIASAFKDIAENPTNILKYQSNPKVMAFINKMASKFAGSGGAPGGFPGFPFGMPTFPGAGTAPADGGEPPKPKPPQDDVHLD